MEDIVSLGFDAGIRFGKAVEKDMVAIAVGPPLYAQIIASPAYLSQFGVPTHPEQLVTHDCIGYRHTTSGQIERWTFVKDGEKFELQPKGRLVLNDLEILVRSALDGLGIAYMINGFIEPFIEQGQLVRLLKDWSPVLPSLHLYYPDRRRVPAKLRALIDFLRSERDIAPPVPNRPLIL